MQEGLQRIQEGTEGRSSLCEPYPLRREWAVLGRLWPVDLSSTHKPVVLASPGAVLTVILI